MQKSKANTARVVVNQELGVVNSYTLEASFCGPNFGSKKDTQFSTQDLENMGTSWCRSLLVYYELKQEVLDLEAKINEKGPLETSLLPEVQFSDNDLLDGSILHDCETEVNPFIWTIFQRSHVY